MKSNLITRMITVCMCMVVVGFASEGKQHLNEQQLQNPVSIDIQDKASDYSKAKKDATYKANKLAQVQSPSESRDIKRINEMIKNQAQSNKLDNGSVEPTENPNTNPENSNRDASVEVYFCTDYWASESSFNITGAAGLDWVAGLYKRTSWLLNQPMVCK